MNLSQGLSHLEIKLKKELKQLAYPPFSWMISKDPNIYDVMIIRVLGRFMSKCNTMKI